MSGAYWQFRLLKLLAPALPPRAALACAVSVADVWWRSAPRQRAAVAERLRVITGRDPDTRTVREVFRNFGRYLAEFFACDRVSLVDMIVSGREHLEAARTGGRGVILLTAHLGNWELGAAMVRRLGYEFSAVAMSHADVRTTRIFDEQRARYGISTIPLGPDAWGEGLAVLRAGGILGLVGDRPFGSHVEDVPLFGRTTPLPAGPALMALRSGAAVVPVFFVRRAHPWSFRLAFEPAVSNAVPGREAAAGLLRAYATVLERYIREYPEQWMIFQSVNRGL